MVCHDPLALKLTNYLDGILGNGPFPNQVPTWWWGALGWVSNPTMLLLSFTYPENLNLIHAEFILQTFSKGNATQGQFISKKYLNYLIL